MTLSGSEAPQRPDLILLMAYPYPPCPAPGATRPSHFAKYLRRSGYNVRVVTAFDDGTRDEVIFVPERKDRRTPAGVSEMVLRKFFFPSDQSMLWAWDAAATAGPLVGKYRKTAVFSTFPPVNSHLAAWLLKRRHGVRWVADFRDPLVGSPGRKLTNSRLAYGAMPTNVDRWIQQGVFRTADAIVANTDAVLERWRVTYPGYARKFAHIWNGFDPEDSMTAAAIPPRERRVIAHVGAIYSGRHPVPLLQSMERLIRKGRLDPRRVLVYLVGAINWNVVPAHDVFERLRELGCVDVGKVLPPSEAHQVMRESDYLLLLDVIAPGAGQQLPSKIFEYVPIGRPILAITTRNSPSDRILAKSGIPYACIYPDATPEQDDEAVLSVLGASSDPAKPSLWFLEQFDAVYRTRALAELLEGRLQASETNSGM